MPAGRPSDYNEKTATEICQRLSEGESLRSITRDKAMPSIKTVYTWIVVHPEFLKQYEQARADQVDTLADEMIEIADDGTNDYVEKQTKAGVIVLVDAEHIQRSRLRVDTRKWIAERMKPKKYGLKSEVTGEIQHTHTVEHVDLEDRTSQILSSRASVN
jgi:hypothetical protein